MQKIFPEKKAAKKAFNLNIRRIMLGSLVFFTLVLFFLPGLALAAPVLSLSSLGGPAGTELVVSGSSFAANISGYVWFDTNGNGTREDNEPKVDVNTNGSGDFSATLTVPSVAPGYYLIRVDLPSGEPIEAEAFFKLTAPVLTMGITSGPPGMAVIVTGYYFAPGKSGWVWLDIDNDNIKDEGEPAMRVNTDRTGQLRASLIITNVPSGVYPIRADLPEGGYVEAWTTFTAVPVINLKPSSGSPGTLITVTGSGFMPGEVTVWLDTNRDGTKDSGEPSTAVTSGADGKIIAALTVPAGLSPGAYPVRASLSGNMAAISNFTVKGSTLSLSPTKGIPGTTVTVTGSRFPVNTPGWVWFDANGDYVRDSSEFSKRVTTNGYGKFTVSLTIPSVPAGVYHIRANLPEGGSIEASGSIIILPAPSLSLSLTTGPPGTIVVVNGKDFKTWTTGKIWFDINGNGKKDAKEPAKSLKTDGFGKFRAALTVPERIPPGAYAIYADVPAWGVPEACTDFFVTMGNSGNGLNGGTLQIVSVIPPDGAERVQRYPTLKVVFASRLVKGPEFGSIVLSDEDGNPVITKATLSGKTLKVRPGGILKGEKTYVLLIPAEAVLSQTNNGLEEEFILTFTTKK